MEVEMTTKMWIVLFVGSALAGVFSAIVVNAAVWLVGKLSSWLTKRAADATTCPVCGRVPSTKNLCQYCDALFPLRR